MEEKKKAVEAGLALLEQVANASLEAADAEYEKVKKDTEDKCQKELDVLKKKLEDNAASVEKTKDAAALKKLKKEEKDTNEKIAQVNKKYAGLAGKVQDAYKKRKEGIQSTKLRLSRKVKGGQALSEEELKKEFNLKEVPPAAEEGDTKAEEEKPEKGKEKPAPDETKAGADKTWPIRTQLLATSTVSSPARNCSTGPGRHVEVGETGTGDRSSGLCPLKSGIRSLRFEVWHTVCAI